MKAFALLLVLGCGASREREQALRKIDSPVARERAAAVRALGSDDASWNALAKAVRDGSPAVRSEAAAALARTDRGEAPDAISPLLRDPDDAVRIAAVKALAQRCGERSEAYLRIAFARSDAGVRTEAIAALQRCGKSPEDTLSREESERRRKAMTLLEDPVAAQRARGARDLSRLCRGEDVAALRKLLEDRDGVAAAAVARGAGECGDREMAPRLTALLDEGGEVSAAAAEALAALGMVDPARPRLRKLAAAEGDEALPAALALGPDCAVIPRSSAAAAVLASGCPAAPFSRALPAAANPAPLLEALLQAQAPAPGLAQALSRMLRAGATDARIPRVAARYGVAGPALVAALRREQASRRREIAGRGPPAESDSAAEIARVPAPGAPDKQKYERLMSRLRERSGGDERSTASARLASLLKPDGQSGRRDLIAGALRAARALHAPGAETVASSFASDPDPLIASAARGEPPPAPIQKPSPSAPLDVRTALWSDDGTVRAEACAAAAASADPAVALARKALARADPERRVRAACSAPNETAPGK